MGPEHSGHTRISFTAMGLESLPMGGLIVGFGMVLSGLMMHDTEEMPKVNSTLNSMLPASLPVPSGRRTFSSATRNGVRSCCNGPEAKEYGQSSRCWVRGRYAQTRRANPLNWSMLGDSR
jgi:hypothetical protein